MKRFWSTGEIEYFQKQVLESDKLSEVKWRELKWGEDQLNAVKGREFRRGGMWSVSKWSEMEGGVGFGEMYVIE